MYEVGRAGAFVSGRTWRRRGAAALYGVAALAPALIAAGCAAGLAYAGRPPMRALAAIGGVAALAACGYACARCRRSLREAGRSAVGARSEREARAAIRRTRPVAVAYGLVLGERAGDCDAVVFTRHGGAAAIEVKTGHGEVAARNGVLRVGRRVLPKNPIRQAEGQARRLSRALGRKPVLAIVFIPGMTNRCFAEAGVWVCGPGELSAVLDRAPRVFASASEAEKTMRRLWPTT